MSRNQVYCSLVLICKQETFTFQPPVDQPLSFEQSIFETLFIISWMKDGISCDGVPWHHRLAPNLDRGDLDSAYIGPTCPSTIPFYLLDHPNHPIGHPTNPIQAINNHYQNIIATMIGRKSTRRRSICLHLLLNLECAYNGLSCPRPGKYDCPLC